MLFTISCCERVFAQTFIEKAKKKKSFKNLGPAAVPVSYKDQRIAWMDSEIARVHFFKMNFRIVQHFP